MTPSRSLKTYALTFFRRFYLRKTSIDYDPDFLLSACLFLGFKVAQISVTLNDMKNICPFLKEKHNEKNVENILLMLEYEFFLINVLNYEFYVFCPYKAMLGFLNEFKKLQESNKYIFLDENQIKEFELKCESYIDKSFMTDLIFTVSYSQISLGCICITAAEFSLDANIFTPIIGEELFHKFLKEILPVIKESIFSLKIISNEEALNDKKKILKFLNRNPRYVEKIEKDRE
jgi:hypothetical protein